MAIKVLPRNELSTNAIAAIFGDLAAGTAITNSVISATVDTAVALSFPTVDGYMWCPGPILASYSATPTAGRFSITNYAVTATLCDVDVTAGGLAPLPSFEHVLMTVSTGMKITLHATTGSTAKGKLNAYPYLVKA